VKYQVENFLLLMMMTHANVKVMDPLSGSTAFLTRSLTNMKYKKDISEIKKFFKFSLIWYSQQFAIPFWVIGHVHLHLNEYNSWIELISSLLMHAAVGVGFFLDWKEYNKN
jgi:hypothetical protein